MTDANGSTPQSSNDANGPKVAKDRNCPFCGQAFTSSSLGRHLDLYIKPKNAKPEDGIHNVEEIRRMRGNITRRQSRISGAGGKRNSSTPAPPAQQGSNANVTVRQILEGNAAAQLSRSPAAISTQFGDEGSGVRINKLGWESTGVINDLPPRLEPKLAEKREMPKHQMLKSDLEQRQKMAEELDNGRAAELALQEVLESVRDASSWYSGRGLFEFDFFALNFPTLCLRLLPAPTTIFSPTPFASADSWSLEPPSQTQYDALRRTVEDRGRVVQRQWQAQPSHSSNSAQMPLEISDLSKFYTHISEAFNHWRGMSDAQRQETWQLEILRSYTRAEEDRKESQDAITSLRRQIDHLSQQLERANNGWSATGAQQYPISQYSSLTSLRLSNDLMKELCKQGVDFRGWDYARLIDKWKLVVREEKKAANGLGSQRALPEPAQTSQQHQNTATLPRPMNGHVSTVSRSASTASAISGAQHGHARTESMESEYHDADGDGDEEDADAEADLDTETEADPQRHQQNQQQRQYQWPPQAPATNYPAGNGMVRLPPGPDDWKREMAHAMDGVEGTGVGMGGSGA